MAIDTAAKRRSAAGVPFLPLGPGVTPDATPGIAWRQQVAWSYSGITTISFSPQIYTANVFCNITPIVSVKSNPSPIVEVKIG